jgi:GNAT superfamily N-acetyltransferase
MLNTDELLALYDREMRIEIEYPGMIKEAFPDLVRFLRPGPGMSFISYSRLTAENADQRIREQIERFSGWDGPFSWDHYSHDQPPDLLERLTAHGFEPEDEPGSVMVLDLSQAPEILFESPGVPLRRIERREELAEVIRIEEGVWGGSFAWIDERLGENLEIPGFLSVYLAEANGVPVSAAWIYFFPNSHFAGLFGGATLPDQRGKGLYTALLSARAREARQRGYRYLTIDAGPMSRPIAARRGFRYLTTLTSCAWKGERSDG